MLFYSLFFTLQLAFVAFAAKSGSQLESYALGDCTNELGILRDLPNDGVQGTPCQSFKIIHRADNTVYRNLAQSVKPINIQAGCVAYAYSAPHCPSDRVILEVNGPDSSNQCVKLNGYAESVQVVCN